MLAMSEMLCAILCSVLRGCELLCTRWSCRAFELICVRLCSMLDASFKFVVARSALEEFICFSASSELCVCMFACAGVPSALDVCKFMYVSMCSVSGRKEFMFAVSLCSVFKCCVFSVCSLASFEGQQGERSRETTMEGVKEELASWSFWEVWWWW